MVNACSGGRRRTKKHKRHSRRRMRGGTTEASFGGVEVLPGGRVDVRDGVNMSGAEFAAVGGRRRRSRKTRRRRRSMRGGSDGSRVLPGFSGESIGGVAVGSAAYGPMYTGVQPA